MAVKPQIIAIGGKSNAAPRSFATNKPAGSMEAASSDAIRILPGVFGTMVGNTRMTTAIHDTPPMLGIGTQWFMMPISSAVATSNPRVRSSNTFGRWCRRAARNTMPIDMVIPMAASTLPGMGHACRCIGRDSCIAGAKKLLITAAISQSPANTMPSTPTRLQDCSSRSDGSDVHGVGPAALGVARFAAAVIRAVVSGVVGAPMIG